VTLELTLVYGAMLGLFALIGVIFWFREQRREEARRRANHDTDTRSSSRA
jgi:hypothetical protein